MNLNTRILSLTLSSALSLVSLYPSSSALPFGDSSVPPPYGHNLRQYFFFADNYTQFNHGAYGGTPKIVVQQQFTYVETMEEDIDPWMNSAAGYRQCILNARTNLSALINAPNVNDTVLVDHATEAINSVLRNLEPPLSADEYIFDLSTAYAPFAALYEWIGARYGTQTLTANIVFPITGSESFLAPVRQTLAMNASSLNIRIAIISHISAYPAAILPVKELVELFHQYQIPVIVDGAHALGNIKIDLQNMGNPEYYFTNIHKWLYGPKSSCLLYVRSDRQLPYVPAPACIDSVETDTFINRYIWTGTRDRSAYCAINDALLFRQFLGGEETIMNYTQSLALQAGHYMAQNFSTYLLTPDNMTSSMFDIVIPTDNTTACAIVNGQLRSQYGIAVSGNGVLDATHGNVACYWRLSAQVYLELSDFQRLASLTVQLLQALNAHKIPVVQPIQIDGSK